jgi:hypothetical protein
MKKYIFSRKEEEENQKKVDWDTIKNYMIAVIVYLGDVKSRNGCRFRTMVDDPK